MDYIDEDGNLVWEAGELDEQIRRALLEMGWIFPTTPEEVAIAEAAMRGMQVELPESLREPPLHLLD